MLSDCCHKTRVLSTDDAMADKGHILGHKDFTNNANGRNDLIVETHMTMNRRTRRTRNVRASRSIVLEQRMRVLSQARALHKINFVDSSNDEIAIAV